MYVNTCPSNEHMKTKTNIDNANNVRLRELIEEHGLTQAAALTVFNRGMGVRPYSMSAWKAFLSDPASDRFRKLSDDLLQHAEKQFARLSKA